MRAEYSIFRMRILLNTSYWITPSYLTCFFFIRRSLWAYQRLERLLDLMDPWSVSKRQFLCSYIQTINFVRFGGIIALLAQTFLEFGILCHSEAARKCFSVLPYWAWWRWSLLLLCAYSASGTQECCPCTWKCHWTILLFPPHPQWDCSVTFAPCNVKWELSSSPGKRREQNSKGAVQQNWLDDQGKESSKQMLLLLRLQGAHSGCIHFPQYFLGPVEGPPPNCSHATSNSGFVTATLVASSISSKVQQDACSFPVL